MLPEEDNDTRYAAPPDAAYRRDYERGWRTWASPSDFKLDRADARNEPDAWYDAYYDRGAGRPKWHSWYCQQAGGCWEHNWG